MPVKKIEKEYIDVIGVPTMMMLPSRNYKFRVYMKDYIVTIPRRGKYMDLDEDIFSEEDGKFSVLRQSKKEGGQIVYLPSLSKILFATKQYPDLTDAQAFVPNTLVVKKDTVDIIGRIIEMIKEDE
jgi:hypothetical protein